MALESETELGETFFEDYDELSQLRSKVNEAREILSSVKVTLEVVKASSDKKLNDKLIDYSVDKILKWS